MSEHAASDGICPACHREGRIGHPCEHGSCAREGVHFIPSRYVVSGRRGDPRVGHVVASHLLVERLHRPSIDTLYRAIQLPALLELEVAFVPAARDKDIHDNLFRQALALGRLGAHPNITRLVLFGAEPAGTYLITEALGDASTLAEVILPEGNDLVPSAGARLLLDPLAAALGALARAHLVHGEIRPEHVLVRAEEGYAPFVQLGGFVRIPSSDGSHPAPVSDLVWRPPELIFKHTVNATTDTYAVAAIAFSLLFGRPPFPAEDRDELLAAKRDASWDPTDGLAAAAPTEVIHFFQAALAYDPAERFAGGGFRNALSVALDAMELAEAGDTVVAPEPAPEPVEEEDRHGRPPRYHRTEELEPQSHEGRPPRFHHAPDDAPAAELSRPGRPPRFHRGTADSHAEPEDMEIEHEAHPDAQPHSGSTQRMSTKELEDLEEHRATPRMHKDR